KGKDSCLKVIAVQLKGRELFDKGKMTIKQEFGSLSARFCRKDSGVRNLLQISPNCGDLVRRDGIHRGSLLDFLRLVTQRFIEGVLQFVQLLLSLSLASLCRCQFTFDTILVCRVSKLGAKYLDLLLQFYILLAKYCERLYAP